jgi:hypothetical protein
VDAAAAALAAAEAAPPPPAPLSASAQALSQRASDFTGAMEACVRPAAPRRAGVHDETEEALSFLSDAYGVPRRGALALLAGAARARLRAFPHALGRDVAALVADAAAGVALGLELLEDAVDAASEVLGAVYGNPGGAAACGDAGGAGGTLFGAVCAAHFDAALRSFIGGEGAAEVEAGLAAARRALLSPRERQARRFLVLEKLLLARIAGWENNSEGAWVD